jgi:hypothetical protein
MSSKIIVSTKTGYNFALNAEAVEQAMSADKLSLAQAVTSLQKFLDALLQPNPCILEANSALQDVALRAAIDAKLPGCKQLIQKDGNDVAPHVPILERLLTSEPKQVTKWLNDDIASAEQAQPLLAAHATVMYTLTGQRVSRELAISPAMKHLRKKVVTRAEIENIDLARKAVIWTRMVEYLKTTY